MRILLSALLTAGLCVCVTPSAVQAQGAYPPLDERDSSGLMVLRSVEYFQCKYEEVLSVELPVIDAIDAIDLSEAGRAATLARVRRIWAADPSEGWILTEQNAWCDLALFAVCTEGGVAGIMAVLDLIPEASDFWVRRLYEETLYVALWYSNEIQTPGFDFAPFLEKFIQTTLAKVREDDWAICAVPARQLRHRTRWSMCVDLAYKCAGAVGVLRFYHPNVNEVTKSIIDAAATNASDELDIAWFRVLRGYCGFGGPGALGHETLSRQVKLEAETADFILAASKMSEVRGELEAYFLEKGQYPLGLGELVLLKRGVDSAYVDPLNPSRGFFRYESDGASYVIRANNRQSRGAMKGKLIAHSAERIAEERNHERILEEDRLARRNAARLDGPDPTSDETRNKFIALTYIFSKYHAKEGRYPANLADVNSTQSGYFRNMTMRNLRACIAEAARVGSIEPPTGLQWHYRTTPAGEDYLLGCARTARGQIAIRETPLLMSAAGKGREYYPPGVSAYDGIQAFEALLSAK